MEGIEQNYDIELARAVAAECDLGDAMQDFKNKIERDETPREIDDFQGHIEHAQSLILPAIKAQRELLNYLGSVIDLIAVHYREKEYELNLERMNGGRKVREFLDKQENRLDRLDELERLARENGWEAKPGKGGKGQRREGGEK